MPNRGGGRPRLCFITAVPMTASAFLVSHLEKLRSDYELFLISNFSAGVPDRLEGLATCVHIPIQRKIVPWADLFALFALVRCMCRLRFDLVQSVTPKAGLLGMLAARMTGIRCRVHWFTGQVWATRQGVARCLLKGADRIIAASASALLTDSRSQRAFLLDERVCAPGKLDVIADGSICGVDSERFRPDILLRQRLREKYAIPPDAVVCLYLGRLARDKGMQELAAAIPTVCDSLSNAHFMIIGPDEDDLASLFSRRAAEYPGRVHMVGHTATPEQYMMAADIFCLPSYREGFGSVIIEAAACGLPAIASRVYGLTDAVEDGVTGLLVPVRDSEALAAALLQLSTNHARRECMGEAARMRATTVFARSRVVNGLAHYYAKLLKNA